MLCVAMSSHKQESVPDPGCSRPRHIWTGRQVPEPKDTGSCRSQGCEEPDRLLQSEHDGSFRARSGKTILLMLSTQSDPPQLNTKLDKNDDHHILRLKDTFIHRQHLCLVFELLSVNLYELIKQNQFRGLSTTLVRVFAQQLLNGLTLLNKARLIHCDLKPENILLKK